MGSVNAGGWCGTLGTGRGDGVRFAGAERRSIAWNTRWVALCSCRTGPRERLPLPTWGMVSREAPLALHVVSGLVYRWGSQWQDPLRPTQGLDGARRLVAPSHKGGVLLIPGFTAGRLSGFLVGCVEVPSCAILRTVLLCLPQPEPLSCTNNSARHKDSVDDPRAGVGTSPFDGPTRPPRHSRLGGSSRGEGVGMGLTTSNGATRVGVRPRPIGGVKTGSR